MVPNRASAIIAVKNLYNASRLVKMPAEQHELMKQSHDALMEYINSKESKPEGAQQEQQTNPPQP